MRLLLTFLVCLFISLCGSAAAQDEGLYAPKAPEGASFIRFVNAYGTPVEISLDQKSYGSLEPMSASPYYVTQEGNREMMLGKDKHFQTIQGGKYYTLVAIDNSLETVDNEIVSKRVILIEDQSYENRAKALIALYNLQDDTVVNLRAKKGQILVIEDVPTGEYKIRAVNPTKIDLSVHDDGRDDFVALDPFIMERGSHYSIFYNGQKAFMVMARIDTTQ